jgi:MarR family transcriptional regulator for hemolysin
MTQDGEDVYVEALDMPGYLAHHATRVFNRRVDAALKPHGVSIALLGPLLLLSRRGTLLQRDLVRGLGVGQPAMVPILAKLEAAGLVERSSDAADRRAAPIRLTAAGQDVVVIGKQVLIDANKQGLHDFSGEDATRLVRLLQRLIANLEAPLETKHQM